MTKKLTRREFLKGTAAAGGMLALPIGCHSSGDNPLDAPMTVTIVIENAPPLRYGCPEGVTGLQYENGIAIHIAKGDMKILYDFATTPRYVHNAQRLGVPIDDVTMAILGHVHIDHSGGIVPFFKNNSKATLYLNDECKYYTTYYAEEDIDPETLKPSTFVPPSGIPPAVFDEYWSRFRLLTEDTAIEVLDRNANSPVIHWGVHILKDIKVDWWSTPGQFIPENKNLRMVRQEFLNVVEANLGLASGRYELIDDDLSHENVFVMEHRGGIVIVSGCSHNGIVNIVKTVQQRFRDKPIWALFGGFHFCDAQTLYTRDVRTQVVVEATETIYNVAYQLWKLGVQKVYTGHCTGVEGFEILQESGAAHAEDYPEFEQAIRDGYIEYFGTGCRYVL